jgi:tetratricopeptide (TPR) repeat protein
MGNEVNMAARLMSKAQPGQILVRRRVAEEAKQGFQFHQLGLITVKGGAEPIPVAEVLGRQQSQALQGAQYELPLVGRESELAQLERLLDSALARRGQVVTLQGPTGIGKTHLVSVFRQYASANGFQVISATGQRIYQSSTYWPWQQALRQLLGLAADAGSETLPTQVELVVQTLTQMNPDWAIRAPLLSDVLGLPLPDNPTTAAFDPRQRQEALFAFIIEIIRTWSRSQPLLMVFDNSHWIDESSRALLEALVKVSGDVAVMVVAVVRPAAETDSQAEPLIGLRAHRHHHLMPLGELSATGVGHLVGNVLGGPPSLLARLLIEAKAQGNPFFTRELVEALRESNQLINENGEWVLSESMIDALRTANVLVREEGTWVLAQAADLSTVSLGIPDSIHGVILARLDRLPDSHKPTIKVASVIGYSFELGLLAQVHPAQPGPAALRTQAHTLEERDFIVHDYSLNEWEQENNGTNGHGRYTFRQQATQEVSYETLLFTQRRELHRSLAALLEQQSPEAIDQIAYHAYLGEDWARSLRYHLLSGVEDKKLFANLQSMDHFRKALASAERLPPDETLAQRREINAELGELLLTVGQRDAAIEHLRTSLQLAEELGDPEAQANACRWLARAHELRGEYQPALEWIDRGLALLGDTLTPSSLELRLIGGLIYSRQGEYRQASQQALACLLAAEELRQPSIVARAHNLLGTIDRLRGNLADAAEHFQESLAIYREIGNMQGQALAQNSLANALFDLGRWSDADRYYHEAGRIFSQLGNVYNRLLVDNNLGGIALNQGRLDDALHYYQRALRALEQIGGSLWVMGAINLNLGATHVRRGETATAFEHLERSRELFERAKVRDLLPEMHRRLAEAHLLQGATAEARRDAETSLALAQELSMLAEQGQTLRVLGTLAEQEGQLEEAEEHLLRSIGILTDVGENYGLACAQLSLAELYRRQGQAERAEPLLAACLPVLESLGAALELARAQVL